MHNETSYFLLQIISFKKYFYVSLGNNFFTVFVEAPLVVDALGNCPVCPPLNPALPVTVIMTAAVKLPDSLIEKSLLILFAGYLPDVMSCNCPGTV